MNSAHYRKNATLAPLERDPQSARSRDLLSAIRARGVIIWEADGDLHIQAVKGMLYPDELDALRTLKPEIIRLLEQSESVPEIALRRRVAGSPVPVAPWVRDHFRRTNSFKSTRFCQVAARISGPLCLEFLRRSIEALIIRHESLRTRLVEVDGLVWQQIDSPGEYKLEVNDLTDRTGADAEGELHRLIEKFFAETIDLRAGPLFDARLYRMSECDHVLVLGIEHFVSDGVSLQILDRELWTLYKRAMHAIELLLPPVPVQFGDFTIWQYQTASAWLKKHGNYWKDRLNGSPCVNLPMMEDVKSSDNVRGAMLQIPLGEAQSERLREFARCERTLLPIVVLTIYVAAISRWCNQHDLLVLFVSHGRDRPELRDMIGMLATWLYLRLEIVEDESFLDLLRRVDREFRHAHDHQGISGVPAFFAPIATDFDFNWSPINWVEGTVGSSWEIDARTIVRPYSLKRPPWPCRFQTIFSDSANGIIMTIVYRPDLIGASTIEWFGCSMNLLAGELIERGHTCLASLPMHHRPSS
jgi:Condensation domain/TubC N-terminal docking domain